MRLVCCCNSQDFFHDDNAGAPARAQSPTLLYYCHRKGWQITPDEFSEDRLDSLAGLGATHFVVAGWAKTKRPAFWRGLLRRGVSIPPAYPRIWYGDADLRRGLVGYKGAEREFIVVRLNAPIF